MMRAIVFVCLVVVGTAGSLQADEKIRQVQEELRKRNLYFGNVDGQESAELSGALQRYQARKGFAVTGSVDNETAASLHILTTVASTDSLPDVPVLRSDSASALPEERRLALQKEGEQDLDLSPTPAAPAESPGPEQNLSPEQVTKFVKDYLHDAETDDVSAQVRYFTFPVEYFHDGPVDERFVTQDVRGYIKRWSARKYTLTTPVTFFASGKENETQLEFTIAFDVQSKARTTRNKASGRTRNWWTLRPAGNELKIVSIREERIARIDR